MKRLVIYLCVFSFAGLMAQTKPIQYVGSLKCKTCHKKVEQGEQYRIWEEGVHAGSYETLLTEESKKIAQKMGLSTAPEISPECLRCHVTGWGEKGGYSLDVDPTNARFVKVNNDLARVGCESCHGPGNAFKSKKIMKQINTCEISGENLGFKVINKETCTSCHNSDSPTYKEFDYDARIKEIVHPVPERVEVTE